MPFLRSWPFRFTVFALFAVAFSPALAVVEPGTRAAILYDSNPAAVSILDLRAESFVSFPGTASDPRVLPLPVPDGERPRAFCLSSANGNRSLWIATDATLVRLDTATGRFDLVVSLPWSDEFLPTDLVTLPDGDRELVAVALSPFVPDFARVAIFDPESGEELGRYDSRSSRLSSVVSMIRTNEVVTILNRRDTSWGPQQFVLTNLVWEDGQLVESLSSYSPDPGSVVGDPALSPLVPGIAAVPSTAVPVVMLVDCSMPTGLEPHPYVEWAARPVAAAASPKVVNRWGTPNLFVADAATGRILALDGWDGEPRAELDAAAWGARPEPGSSLLLSPTMARGFLTAPSSNRILTFHPGTLVLRKGIATPLPRPKGAVILP